MSEYTAEDFASLRHDLALARKELADLRKENDRLGRVLQSPLLLDALEAAWGSAEQATECRKGDVLIVPGSWGGYTIWEAARNSQLRVARILSRAPKREPWAELAGVLKAHTGEPDPDETARMLYENGVRVTGGEES